MRWTMFMALAGAVFAVASSEITEHGQGTPSSIIDKSKKADQQSEHTTKSSVLSKGENAKGSESNSAPKAESKREIPDALVDHPEEFENRQTDSEELEVDNPSIHIIPEGDLPFIQTSSSDEDADKYPFYGAAERKKRGAQASRKRSKRQPRFDEDTPEILKILESLKKGHEQQKQSQQYGHNRYYQHHYHHQQEDEQEQQQPVDYLEWDNDSAQESDRIVNDVLESLGLGRSPKLIIPSEPEIRNKFIPLAKLRVPFGRRPIL